MIDETRQAAARSALALIEHGDTVTAATNTIGAQLGVTGRTVQRWAQKFNIDLPRTSRDRTKNATAALEAQYEERRARIRVTLLELVENIAGRALTEEDPKGTKDHVISVGILIDKIRLEEGKATERSEHVALDAIDRALDHWEELLSAND